MSLGHVVEPVSRDAAIDRILSAASDAFDAPSHILYSVVRDAVEATRRDAVERCGSRAHLLHGAHNEVARLQQRLDDSADELRAASEERDRAHRALEEAHACVSAYHRKMSAMERTVGYSLLCRAENKDLAQKLREAEELAGQCRLDADAARRRIGEIEERDAALSDELRALKGAVAQRDALVAELRALLDSSCDEQEAREAREKALEQRVGGLEAQLRALEGAKRELEGQHHESLEALSDLVDLQKSMESERGALLQRLEDVQAQAEQQQATIEGLRGQVAKEQQHRLRTLAESSYAGVAYESAQRSAAACAVRDALNRLEVALPALASASAGAVEGSATIKAGDVATRLGDELRRLREQLSTASRFTEEDDQQHTLYHALRDVLAALESTLGDVFGLCATVTDVAKGRITQLSMKLTTVSDDLADSRHTCREFQGTVDSLQAKLEQEGARVAAAGAQVEQIAEQRRRDVVASEEALVAKDARIAQLDAQLAAERAQRQRAEADRQTLSHHLHAELHQRTATLRDAFQRQLDALHGQVVEMERHTRLWSPARSPRGATPAGSPLRAERRLFDDAEKGALPRSPGGRTGRRTSALRSRSQPPVSPQRAQTAPRHPARSGSVPRSADPPSTPKHSLESSVARLQQDVRALASKNRLLEDQMDSVLHAGGSRRLEACRHDLPVPVLPLFRQPASSNSQTAGRVGNESTLRHHSASHEASARALRPPHAPADSMLGSSPRSPLHGECGAGGFAALSAPVLQGDVLRDFHQDRIVTGHAVRIPTVAAASGLRHEFGEQENVTSDLVTHSEAHSSPSLSMSPHPRSRDWHPAAHDGAAFQGEMPREPRAVPPEVLAAARRFDGPEGASRPATAAPASRAWTPAGEPAPAEVLDRARNYEGEEGHGRPKTAGPSDHWRIRASTPASLALPMDSYLNAGGAEYRCREPAAQRGPSLTGLERSPTAAEQAESIVVRALEKSGLLNKARNLVKQRNPKNGTAGLRKSARKLQPRGGKDSVCFGFGSHGPGPVGVGQNHALKYVNPLDDLAASDWPAVLRSQAFDQRLTSPRRSIRSR